MVGADSEEELTEAREGGSGRDVTYLSVLASKSLMTPLEQPTATESACTSMERPSVFSRL